jgi:HlyD family secretion protein
MKRKKSLIIVFIIIIICITGFLIARSMNSKQDTQYQFGTITRGDLETTVSATGTLSPLTIVDVGTQVSGTIDSVYVDYNDKVKAGQLLAVMDSVLLKAAVVEAQANYDKASADLEEANFNYDLNNKLYEKQLISESDFVPYKINLATQKANLKSAEASLTRAKQNLDYAIIRSPISGTVIEKNVESGQTVAASLSAPTLFEIAQDLSRMEILADVDESDIGLIKDSIPVHFEVQAYSDKTFSGIVRQIRIQPQTISNVVTYTVVVNADNKEGLLLPGMTATVDFIIEQKKNVLMVPSKALRYNPSDEAIAAMQKRRQKAEAGTEQKEFAPPPTGDSTNMRERPTNMSMLWYFNDKGELSMEPVQVGMTDGVNTEISGLRHLKEGSEVIIGDGTFATTENGTNSTNDRRRFGPPMF